MEVDNSHFSFHNAPGKSNLNPDETQNDNRTIQDKDGGNHPDVDTKTKGKVSKGGTL